MPAQHARWAGVDPDGSPTDIDPGEDHVSVHSADCATELINAGAACSCHYSHPPVRRCPLCGPDGCDAVPSPLVDAVHSGETVLDPETVLDIVRDHGFDAWLGLHSGMPFANVQWFDTATGTRGATAEPLPLTMPALRDWLGY
jgi:hypothetical protein